MNLNVTRIVLVDPQRLYRDSFSALVNQWPEFCVVGEFESGEEALDFFRTENTADMVLIEADLPCKNGIETSLAIRNIMPEVKIVIITSNQDKELISLAADAAFNGYLLKNTPATHLKEQLLGILAGEVALSGAAAAILVDEFRRRGNNSIVFCEKARGRLTDDEAQLLDLIVHGLPNEDIAEKLYLSVGTVKKQVSALMQKLEVDNRVQLAIYAVHCGIGVRRSSSLILDGNEQSS